MNVRQLAIINTVFFCKRCLFKASAFGTLTSDSMLLENQKHKAPLLILWHLYQVPTSGTSVCYLSFTGVVLQFCIKKQRNKALFLENKALLRIKVWVNFIFIFQNLLFNHFYCMLFSSWLLIFPLTICFIIQK